MEETLEKLKIHRTIMDMIEDHIMVCKLDGTIIFTNLAIQNYLGHEEEELNGKNFLDMVGHNHYEKAEKLINSSEDTSDYHEFLLKGKKSYIKLNLKLWKNDDLVYIYGNEKYVDYERIKTKLDIEIANAIKIHRQSLPEELPETDDISFSSLYIPAEDLGGDLYDAFKVDNGLLDDYYNQYVSFIADVSGHGLDSAMLAIFVKDTIRSYFNHKHSPGQVLSPKEVINFFLKAYMEEGYPMEYLVCIFLVVIDFETNELTYCNAGFHMAPLLIKDRNDIIQLNKGGFPITTAIDFDSYNYRDNTIEISEDMTLFLMSDGLAEQRSYGKTYEDRLMKLCREIYGLDAHEISKEIKKDLNDFLNYNSIDDDITLVVAKLSGKDK